MPPLVAAVVGASFFVLPMAVRHIRMPPGDDAIYWVLTLRLTARFGLVGPQLAARPAFPLVGSVMGTVTGASAWTIAVVAPIAMAKFPDQKKPLAVQVRTSGSMAKMRRQRQA